MRTTISLLQYPIQLIGTFETDGQPSFLNVELYVHALYSKYICQVYCQIMVVQLLNIKNIFVTFSYALLHVTIYSPQMHKIPTEILENLLLKIFILLKPSAWEEQTSKLNINIYTYISITSICSLWRDIVRGRISFFKEQLCKHLINYVELLRKKYG